MAWIWVRQPAYGSMSFQADIKIALHALTAALVIWGDLKDWRRREVADWPTWPSLVMDLG